MDCGIIIALGLGGLIFVACYLPLMYMDIKEAIEAIEEWRKERRNKKKEMNSKNE
ncbi:MAG: hypothetical protein ACTSX6_07575 [Candidatus Heimdallarchaeaceae archaeon]